MGTFRVELEAVGGHGCQRDRKDGETVYGCGSMTCPDCITAEYVAKLQRSGANVSAAALIHWPGQSSQVTDEFVIDALASPTLAKRTRKGSF